MRFRSPAAASAGIALIALACAEELPAPIELVANGDAGGVCVCELAHATGTCATGACVVDSCEANYGNCDLIDKNGCEQPLNVEGHCGACQRSCLGTACVESACEAATLVSGLTDPWGVLVDGVSIYFSDFTDGIIDRASKLDGSGRTSLANGYEATWFMVMDGGYIYFTTRGGNTVERVLVDGSEPAETFLSPGVKTSGLAIDANNIYFSQSELGAFVWRAAKKKNSLAVRMVTEQDNPVGVAVDDTNAYWGSGSNIFGNGEVRRVAKNIKSDTVPGQKIALGQGEVRGILVDENMVYWTSIERKSDASGAKSVGRLTRYNTVTSGLEVLAITEPAEELTVDEKYVYWTASDDSVGRVYRLEKDYVPAAGPPPLMKVFSQVGAKPHGIAADATALYVTERGQGRILKLAK